MELHVVRLAVAAVAASNMATPEEKEAFVDSVEHGFIQGPRLSWCGRATSVDDDEQSD
jgi:hypothetical protein